jgi:phenylacetate-CoA ligase
LLTKKVTNWIERVETFSTYVIRDDILEKDIEKMRRSQPEIVKGYATSVYFVARKLIEKGIEMRPRAVITSAESLLPKYRRTIEEAFGCRVFDFYGSREIGAMAAECEVHSGYHISAENVLLEFVKEGEHVAPGERGEIIATNLRNFGMPLIRYRIGDVGIPSGEHCSCGRGLPLLKSLDGRVSQFISILDKEIKKVIPVLAADPGIIGKVMDEVPIYTYRVLQEDLDKVTIKIVPQDTYSEKDTKFVLDYVNSYIGKNIEVEVKLVDEIPPLPSGKRSVVISKINPFNE